MILASPPPNVGSGLGVVVVAIGLIVPWALLVYVDRRLRAADAPKARADDQGEGR